MIDLTSLSTAAIVPAMFLVGLLGASHCAGMCGPIALVLGGASERRGAVIWGYQLGRISSYLMVGLAAGAISQFASQWLALAPLLRLLAAALLLAMGLYIMGLWHGLSQIEKLGARLWRRIQPLAGPLGAVRGAGGAYAVGLVWGWLPCGLVYTAVGMALASGSLLDGALAMAAFGIGTLPAMVAVSWFSGRLTGYLQSPLLRRISGLIVVAMALVMAAAVWQHSGHRSAMQSSDGEPQQHHHR